MRRELAAKMRGSSMTRHRRGADNGQSRWFPLVGFVVAQALVLFAFAQPLFGLGGEPRGVAYGGAGGPFSEDATNAFLLVAILAGPLAPLVGVADGAARRARRRKWRVLTSALIAGLGLWTALVGTFAIGFTESVFSSDPVPVPFEAYVGGLVGMETVLLLEWAMATAWTWLGSPEV